MINSCCCLKRNCYTGPSTSFNLKQCIQSEVTPVKTNTKPCQQICYMCLAQVLLQLLQVTQQCQLRQQHCLIYHQHQQPLLQCQVTCCEYLQTILLRLERHRAFPLTDKRHGKLMKVFELQKLGIVTGKVIVEILTHSYCSSCML